MIERYTHPQMAAIWSEDHKFELWLRVELAACEAWAKLGLIPQDDLAKLKGARLDRQRMYEVFKQTHHDMTAFLAAVTESLGPEGRFLHHGLTSSDVMDTALSVQMVAAADLLADDVSALTRVLERRAIEHKDTLMIGRTHGVHAEPMTFGLKLALWVEEMRRNAQRLQEARNVASVGKISGAVGTYATVPPQIEEHTCAKLGLAPAPISSQVLQRDRHAQLVTTLAIIGGSLEKFATEIRHLQRTEVREAEEPFEEGQTGSSAMPHKRNPEHCERNCGQARLLRGYAQTALENIALWHERDISHSSTERIIIPDSTLLLDYMLRLFTFIMDKLQVFPDRMRQNLDLTRGLIFSQRVLLALVERGLSRQEAYRLVQGHAMRSWQGGQDFLSLLVADPQITQILPANEIKALFDYRYYVKYVDETFRRVGLVGGR
ncbi:MAG: adenylosuccinate lyase [Dehalococcoidia bacterium]|nr:adenylosuccinate lyase [Dehalococcoidia bacterium]